MGTRDCPGAQVCTADGHCAPCRALLEVGGARGPACRPEIPVRRYGTAPALLEEEEVEEPRPPPVARTIGERGALAVLLAALTAAGIAGWFLYR